MRLPKAGWIAFAAGALAAWPAWARPDPDDPPSFLLSLSVSGEGDGANASTLGYIKSGVAGTVRFELLPGTLHPDSFSAPRLRISHPSWASEFEADLGIRDEPQVGRPIRISFEEVRCPLAPLPVEVTPVAWRRSPRGTGLAALVVEVRLLKTDPAFRWITRDGVPLPARTPKTPPPIPEDYWPPVPPVERRRESIPGLWGFYVESGVYFQSGDYGTSDETRLLYAPLVLGGWYDRFVGSLTVPFEIMDLEDTVGSGGRLDRNIEAGLGDLWFSAGVYVLDRRGGWPYVLLEGHVKFPTADEDRGLGTGEYDFGGRVRAGMEIGGGLGGYAEAGYGSFGEPEYASAAYGGAWMYGLGLDWKAPGGREIWIFLKGHTEIVEGTDPALMLYVQYYEPLSSREGISLLAGVGLADGSPDYLLGLSFRIYLK